MFVVAHNGARIWGGAERATALLLAGLQARGHRVLLLCNDGLVARRAGEMGVPTRIVPLGGDAVIPHALRLAGVLREVRPDAFIVGTFRKLFLAALGRGWRGCRASSSASGWRRTRRAGPSTGSRCGGGCTRWW